MEYVSLSINLLSLYYLSLLNTFPREAKDPHLVARSQGFTRDPGHGCPLTPLFLPHHQGGKSKPHLCPLRKKVFSFSKEVAYVLEGALLDILEIMLVIHHTQRTTQDKDNCSMG